MKELNLPLKMRKIKKHKKGWGWCLLRKNRPILDCEIRIEWELRKQLKQTMWCCTILFIKYYSIVCIYYYYDSFSGKKKREGED
jgi:hypothetical protein